VLDALPDEAFGQEDNAAVVIDMVVGSCVPAVEAAGETTAQAALELIEAIRERSSATWRPRPSGQPSANATGEPAVHAVRAATCAD
jgi:hypothetical protein